MSKIMNGFKRMEDKKVRPTTATIPDGNVTVKAAVRSLTQLEMYLAD